MLFRFTKEQESAIHTRDCELLVAAAAGSGKTAVLVERIMSMIEEAVDIDKLLVVTFTDAAAGEMRSRIASAIFKRLEENPENEHMQRQNILINKAQITTIHSFCLQVIRKHFHLLDMDPNFRIADDIEVKLLQAQVLDELLEKEYSEGHEDFFKLVESYGGGKLKDEGLKKLILDVYAFISSSPWPVESLNQYAEMFNLPDDAELETTEWGKVLKSDIKNEIIGVQDNIKRAKQIAMQPDGPSKYLAALDSDRIITDEILKLDSFEMLYNYFEQIKFATLARYTKKDIFSEELKAKVQKIRDDGIKEKIKKLSKKIFIKRVKDMHSDIKSLYPIINRLCQIVLEFMNVYQSLKKEKNLADFNDLEHFCLEILLDKNSTKGNPKPSRTALQMQNKYAEILIDEYQDSNLVQELILYSISPSKRFMVGDIKQSIYKFRRAMPELFLEKYNRFPIELSGNTKSMRIDLSKNFRSRESVLEAVNFFFYQLMSGQATDILYDEQAALYAGADFPETELKIAKAAEVHLIEYNTVEEDENLEELSKSELEAELIAKRIEELLTSGLHIYELGEYRQVEYRDIIILVRSLSAHSATLIEVLKRHNIPAFANMGGGYFDSWEIMTILSFLQIIDNPRQDIHLITVLYSPVYFLKPDELLDVRLVEQKSDFYTCLQKYLQLYERDMNRKATLEKLQRFWKDLEKWRAEAAYTPISKLINILYDDTGYYHYVGVMSAGSIRQANLRALQERGIKYEKSSYKGLFHFIRYIERVKKESIDAPDAKVLSANENLVNIMTIHKSKGLEFPIVFVSMLGHKFNTMDERKPVIMHQDLGFGPVYIDLEKRIKSNTIPHMAIARKIHQENLAEELRVLYVALTRPKELLILTGTTRDMEKLLEKHSAFIDRQEINLPIYAVFSASSYLDWIMCCLLRHKTGLALLEHDGIGSAAIANSPAEFEIFLHNAADIMQMHEVDEPEAQAADMRLRQEKLASLHEQNKGLENLKIIENLLWQYPNLNQGKLPQKISIAEVKRIYQREMNVEDTDYLFFEKPVFSQPNFLQETKTLSSVQKGTIMHTVLEHMDMKKYYSSKDIQDLVRYLCEINLLEESEAEAVNIEKLQKFSASDLAERMRRSNFIKRETAFVLNLSPYEVYRSEQLKDSKALIMVHGIIDCYFEEEGEIVLVDYKTDYVNSTEQIIEKYKLQLLIYKKAIMQSTGKPVKECILYLFGLDKMVEISDTHFTL